jgi:SAM-dependent methyltransferase
LIDFYWAVSDDIEYYSIPGLNEIYGEDKEAFAKIKSQITAVDFIVKQEVEDSKKILHDLGKTYYDGSSKHIGKTYHPIDIHYYEDIPYHFDIKHEFQNVINNITVPVKTVIDIGCAYGFYLFNLMRLFEIKQAIGYEADPITLSFLKKIKNIFCLNELELYGEIDNDTVFEDSDLVICMNVHMWLTKQFEEKCDNIISRLIKKSKEMFFQTASLESSGKYIVKEFKTSDDIRVYLEKLGGEKVELIYNSMRCGIRYLFKISKRKFREN